MTTELYSIDTSSALEHYGVRGMKWYQHIFTDRSIHKSDKQQGYTKMSTAKTRKLDIDKIKAAVKSHNYTSASAIAKDLKSKEQDRLKFLEDHGAAEKTKKPYARHIKKLDALERTYANKTNRKQVDKAIKNLGGNSSKYKTTGVDQYGRVTTLKFDV